ncbi:growth-regulating factor 7-like isoform X1 [Phoenix dactylifera]|uniref:Growth-regulating factor n=1 Tax=Phoenix dactylifera TaxID=42345 RepID=A0A8B7D2K3_PHODC|nr:growth-regulating factor 7-like isoform X1 [Phoenix dactylifera]
METGVGLGDKRERKEDEESLGLGFGCGSDSISFAPHQKLIRTAGFPFLSCTTRDGGSVPTSTPFLGSGPTLFLNDAYDGGRALQPFPIPFRSPGVAMGVGGSASAAALRAIPFTSAQWQELQRQALIYKHIIASVPVPPDLLFPSSPPHHLLPNQTVVVGRGSAGAFNLRFSGNTDPEPGRCRRTDGKKWRCSRDAAPDQKYCERHLHRGRPRSRKPVEVGKTKPITSNAPPPTAVSTNSPTIVTAAAATTATATAAATTTSSLSKPFPSQSSVFFPKDELKFPFQPLEPNKEPRCLDWIKGNNEEMESSLQWELMHSKIGLSSSSTPILQSYDDHLNSSYTAFLNPDFCSLEEDTIGDHREIPRSFIDAWSTENPAAATTKNGNLTSVPAGGELPLSTLTLSMSGVEEGGDHQIQMGLGVGDTLVKTRPSGWIAPASPLGGPLGEVLQTSNATSPRQGFVADDCRDSGSGGLINCMSIGFHGSQAASPQESPTRLASSPSGVLQKAMVSLSDSSSSSSPTFAAASRSEIALQWMNQAKQQ